MGEIVITNKSTIRTDGESASAEEKADYLLRNGYPVPTYNRDKLIDIIMQSEEKQRELEHQDSDSDEVSSSNVK